MRKWASTVGAILVVATTAGVAGQASAWGLPDPGMVAWNFLADLDRGAFSTAYRKLDPLAQKNYDYATFVTAARSLKQSGAVSSSRQRTYVGPADRFNVQAQQTFRKADVVSRYVVACFREQPISGWGRLNYVEVVMTRSGDDFLITNFNSRSEPGQNCPK